MTIQNCSHCGGCHFGSNSCPYLCKNCGLDIRPNGECKCETVCEYGCRGKCGGHMPNKSSKPSIDQLQAQVAQLQTTISQLREQLLQDNNFSPLADEIRRLQARNKELVAVLKKAEQHMIDAEWDLECIAISEIDTAVHAEEKP